jgi:hypothetical protein
MNIYQEEWIQLLQKQKYEGWLIASDRKHIFINVPDNQNLDDLMEEFRTKIPELRKSIKSPIQKLSLFIGNSIDSKFLELS